MDQILLLGKSIGARRTVLGGLAQNGSVDLEDIPRCIYSEQGIGSIDIRYNHALEHGQWSCWDVHHR